MRSSTHMMVTTTNMVLYLWKICIYTLQIDFGWYFGSTMLRQLRVGCYLYKHLLIVYLFYFWVFMDCFDWFSVHHIVLVFCQLFDTFLERKARCCYELVVVLVFYCWSFHLVWIKPSFILVLLESTLVGMYTRVYCRSSLLSYCSLCPEARVVSIGWLLYYHRIFFCPGVLGHVGSGSVA